MSCPVLSNEITQTFLFVIFLFVIGRAWVKEPEKLNLSSSYSNSSWPSLCKSLIPHSPVLPWYIWYYARDWNCSFITSLLYYYRAYVVMCRTLFEDDRIRVYSVSSDQQVQPVCHAATTTVLIAQRETLCSCGGLSSSGLVDNGAINIEDHIIRQFTWLYYLDFSNVSLAYREESLHLHNYIWASWNINDRKFRTWTGWRKIRRHPCGHSKWNEYPVLYPFISRLVLN